jgi:hypothetical protein
MDRTAFGFLGGTKLLRRCVGDFLLPINATQMGGAPTGVSAAGA